MSKSIRARINDDRLTAAIEDAAEEHGSISEAVRHAIDQTYSDDSATDDDEPETVADQLSDSSLRKALRQLWQIARGRDGGREDVGYTSADAAMSVLAQEFSVNKAAVKPMYLTPLRAADVIDVESGADRSTVYVVDPNATPADAATDAVNAVEADHDPDDDEATNDSDIDVDDRLAEIDDAEPVRADGGDKTDDDAGHP